MPTRAQAYVELATAMAIVGSSTVVGKIVVGAFPIALAMELRFLIGLAILVPLQLTAGGLPRIAPRHAAALLAQAIAGVVLLNVLLLYGLTFTTAAEGGIIRGSLPAITAIAAFLVLSERPTRGKVAGVALVVLGIVGMNALAATGAGRGPDPLLGNLLVLLATISEAFFSVFGKMAGRGIPALAISTLLSAFGAVVFLPFAVAEAATFDFGAVPPGGWVAIGYYGVFVTVFAFFLWFHGLKTVGASTAAAFMGVLPISAVLLSYALLGEAIGPHHLVGIACILAGIALTAVGPPPTRATPLDPAPTPTSTPHAAHSAE